MKKLIAVLISLLPMGAALAEEGAAAATPADLPLMVRGLIVTAGGLIGVFLVLILFFLLIKAMQKVLK